MNKLDEAIRDSVVILHPDDYAYLKVLQIPSGKHFFISQDEDEITVVTTASLANSVESLHRTQWFRLFEIRVTAPFLTVGFLAAVTQCVADCGLNILVISTYSKDYIMLRSEDIARGISALEQRGFTIKEKK